VSTGRRRRSRLAIGLLALAGSVPWATDPAGTAPATPAPAHADYLAGNVSSPATHGLVYQPDEAVDSAGALRPQVATPGTTFAGFNTLTPARILDTRTGIGAPVGPVPPSTHIDVAVAGVAGVPAEARVVVLNVTATEPTLGGFLTVWPAGEPQPGTSSLNMPAGKTVPNLVITRVGAGGRVSIYNDSGSTHVFADVLAFARDDGHVVGLSPDRVLDTRRNLGAAGPVGAGASFELPVLGLGGVPAANVGAVVLNVTATEPTAPSFVSVWPGAVSRPNASSLNMVPGQTVANLLIAPVGANGTVAFFNESGSTHLIADVVGWLPAGAAYLPVTPVRVMDTRSGLGTYGTPVSTSATGPLLKTSGPLGPRTTVDLDLRSLYAAYGKLAGYVLNVTVAAPSAASYITVFPTGVAQPTISNVNTVPDENVPNSVVVKAGSGGRVSIFNFEGNAHLIVDLVGVIPRQNALDRPDDTAGPKFHAVYLLGSNSTVDPSMVTKVRTDVEALAGWFGLQTGRQLGIDRRDGQVEVTTWQLPNLTKEQIVAWPNSAAETAQLFAQLADDGFGSPYDRRWLFVIDSTGVATGPCGVALGQFATVYTRNGCADVSGSTAAVAVGAASNSAQIALHEMLHTLGAAPPCAPHYDASHLGHVGDESPGVDGSDLMYFNDGDQPKSIDANHDDYLGTGRTDCTDVAQSVFLRPASG
jgi:hypothetical protein